MGDSKAESLARRIRALSDDIEIEIHVGMLPSTLAEVATTTDVLIDATISHAVAQVVDVIAATPQRIVTIAQVATDTRSGTLGIATISTPSTTDGVTTIDRRAGDTVRVDPELEAYHVFWAEPLSGDEFVPTRGCSVPTFHGSAADIAGVAAALTSFVGQNPRADVSGTHLLALPQSGVAPAHCFVPHRSTSEATDEVTLSSAGERPAA